MNNALYYVAGHNSEGHFLLAVMLGFTRPPFLSILEGPAPKFKFDIAIFAQATRFPVQI